MARNHIRRYQLFDKVVKANQNKLNYIRWQNRAFHFYLGSRLLIYENMKVPAAFCSQQTLELMIKTTLEYQDKSFQARSVGHSFKKMLNILNIKVENSRNVIIPEYFYYETAFKLFRDILPKVRGWYYSLQ